jgi:hypothetical protein
MSTVRPPLTTPVTVPRMVPPASKASSSDEAELIAYFGCLVGEGAEGEDAFGFVADVKENDVGGDGYDGGVDLFRAAATVHGGGAVPVVFTQEGGEVFFGGFGKVEVWVLIWVLSVHVD